MNDNKRRAGIIGASGLVGNHLLKLLLEDDSYDEVVVYARKSMGIKHPRLKEVIGDLLEEKFFHLPLELDQLFCAIGTTQSKTPDVSEYKQIDFGVPVRAAQAAVKGGVKKILVVSSLGANADSKMFYPKVKGQMEDSLKKMSIPHLHIFRPSMLLGKRNEFRFGENIGKGFMKIFGWLLPSKYKGIDAADVALAMYKVAQMQDGKLVYESNEIRKISHN